MQKRTQPLLITAIVIAAALFPAFAQITITENTPERFTCNWNLPELDTISMTIGNSLYTSLTFKGSTTTREIPGEPTVPGYALCLGIPVNGTITRNFTALATKTITLNHPLFSAPKTALVRPDENNQLLSSWVALPKYRMLRSLRTATIVIYPVRLNPQSQSVTFVTSGSLTVTFPKSSYSRGVAPSRNDYEQTLKQCIANYTVAQGFRTVGTLSKRASGNYPLSRTAKSYYFKVGDGHADFNEATIHENGLMKLTGKELRAALGNVDIAKVKVFSSVKGMLPDSLPNDGSIPHGIHELPLIRIDRNNNGDLDDDDGVIVYVTGASDWEGNQLVRNYRFNLNAYDDYRTYWVSADNTPGRTLQKKASGSMQPESVRSTFEDMVRYKQSRLRRDGNPGDHNWLWKVLTKNQRSLEVQLDLPGLDTTKPGTLKLDGYSRHAGYVVVSLGNSTIDTLSSFSESYSIDRWHNGKLHFEYAGRTDTAKIEVSHFDILYQRKIAVGDAPANFTVYAGGSDSGNTVAFDLAVATRQPVYIIRVSPGEQSFELIDTLRNFGTGTYRWTDTAFAGVKYIVCNESGLRAMPTLAAPADTLSGSHLVTDLRGTGNHTDYLIITHPDFLKAADSLARHKERIGFRNPVVVNIFDVYRYFSGGNKDAGALRNFIGCITRYWKNDLTPDYVLLFGTGNYDPKNLSSKGTDYLPVYLDGSDCYENYFVLVAPYDSANENAPQIAIGRLPSLSVNHAWDMVKKIVDTEDPAVADFGEWRNRALFIADDDMQGNDVDPVVSSRPHHLSSDLTAQLVDSIYPSVDLRKVYLYEYAWDQSRQKPGASIALINEINNGVGYINFFGHGADITWTDEYILTADMVSRMSNPGHYPVVSTFSCSVGRFDIPGLECLSGVLTRSQEKGAIATISSTREAYAHANENLAMNFYRFLFDSTSGNSIGTALIAAQLTLGSSGHRTYCILGDPSIRPIRPRRQISLSFDDADDTLAALQKVVVSGTITTDNGTIDRSFSGIDAFIAFGLFNAPDSVTRKDGNPREVRYVLPGTPLFLGKTAVANGTFKQTMLIPQNLTFDKQGVKLTAYAWKEGNPLCAIGHKKDFVFHGSTSMQNITDVAGPHISIRPSYDNDLLSGGNASFADHITVQIPFTCEVELFDSSGIDAAGTGPDEGITIEIEGAINRQNINSKFQFKEGDFRRGIVSVVYEEKVLKPGNYSMTISGRDLIGNLSKKTFALTITDYTTLEFDKVFNFPNPVRYESTTRFYCNSTYTSQKYWKDLRLNLTIRIFTLSGKLVRIIKNAQNGEVWDCRDERGVPLSPDVYLYQITGENSKQNKTTKSEIMKLVILPPK